MSKKQQKSKIIGFDDVADLTNIEGKDEKMSKKAKTYDSNLDVTVDTVIKDELNDLNEHLFKTTTDGGDNPFDDELLSEENLMVLVEQAVSGSEQKLYDLKKGGKTPKQKELNKLIIDTAVAICKDDEELTYEIKETFGGFGKFRTELNNLIKSKGFESAYKEMVKKLQNKVNGRIKEEKSKKQKPEKTDDAFILSELDKEKQEKEKTVKKVEKEVSTEKKVDATETDKERKEINQLKEKYNKEFNKLLDSMVLF